MQKSKGKRNIAIITGISVVIALIVIVTILIVGITKLTGTEAEKPTGEKVATEEKPTKEKPTKEKPTEEKPTKEKPTEEKPTEEKPTEKKPTGEKPTEKKPTKEKVVAATIRLNKNTKVFYAPVDSKAEAAISAANEIKKRLSQKPKMNLVDDISKADVVILPIIISSRVGSDVPAAYSEYDRTLGEKSPTKTIFIQMHHTRDEDFSFTLASYRVPSSFPSGRSYEVVHEAVLLYHETQPAPHLLKCKLNTDEIKKLKKAFGIE